MDLQPGWERRSTPVEGVELLVAGYEVHVELARPGLVTRRNSRAVLQPLLDEHGLVTTRVPHGDTRSRRFVTSIGFKPTTSDDNYTYFILTAPPFTRKEQ